MWQFGYKDYAAGSQRKVMSLGLDEFLRRFCLHLLPERFVKIRHYGLLANRGRHDRDRRVRRRAGQCRREELSALREWAAESGENLPHAPTDPRVPAPPTRGA